MAEKLLNWAGNYEFGAARVHRPKSVEQIQDIVRKAEKVKALGTRHSFNSVADTTGDLVSIAGIDRILELPTTDSPTVLVEPGIRYGDLSEALWDGGFALSNLASLPHISVGGSISTGTHGSGVANPNLSAAACEIELVKADGSAVTLQSGKDPEFSGAVVGIGALGILTKVRLNVVPAFQIAQTVYENLAWRDHEQDLDKVLSGAYSISIFTRWASDKADEVWVKRAFGESNGAYFGAEEAEGPRHPIFGMPTQNASDQGGIYGPAPERLPHFKMKFMPSGGEELQVEYLMPRDSAFSAMVAIDEIRDRIAPLLFVCEIRTVAADDLWLSPSYGRDSVAIHFTWRPIWAEVSVLLPEIESRLAQFGARPHWGKLFDMRADRIRGLYPKMDRFIELAESFDPNRKFRSRFLEETIFGIS